MKVIYSMKHRFRFFLSSLNYLSISSVSVKTMSNFSKVFVRHIDEDDKMKITFMFGDSQFPELNYTFLRSKNEKLETSVTRIKSKIISSMIQKTSKRKKKDVASTSDIQLFNVNILFLKNGTVLNEDVINSDAWTPSTHMKINDREYEIVVNPPGVVQISLPKNIMCGFPVYPKIVLEFCTNENSIFTWYRLLSKSDEELFSNDSSVVRIEDKYYKGICDKFFYFTNETDLGHKLRISCIPKHKELLGMEATAISISAVQPGPGKCPFEDRHKYTTELTKTGSIRYVSYNILADLYADTDTARNELFSYCPAEALELDYRKQLYLKEIMNYNADIICLQEVDRKVFHDDLVPLLSSTGLCGVFNEKGGQVAEGLACFYRGSKFKILKSHAILLNEAVKTEPVLQKIHSKINENEKLVEKFMSRTTALQIVLLESLDVPKKRILIGNTHLYFHPDSDNIRLLQAACCLLYMENLYKHQMEDPSYLTSLALSGDFNSCPEFGVYKLSTEGFLSEECIDWKSNQEEVVTGMDLSHSLHLDSACGTPEYTNYTVGFVGCLDYIFYDKSSLEVSDVVPFPTHEQVVQNIALPNKVFPSDHIALVCTLSWK